MAQTFPAGARQAAPESRGPSALARLLTLLMLAAVAGLTGCQRGRGAYDAFNQADCLPSIPLVDQNGHRVVLSSLKGKPLLVDFIYTRCPGPCLLLTQKMARVASRLPPDIRSRLTLVSISIDPENDGPAQLSAYIKNQDVDAKGWLFLTGAPGAIERVMANFQLRRQRQADGSVSHIAGIFLVGGNGRELREYDGQVATASLLAGEVERLVGGGQG